MENKKTAMQELFDNLESIDIKVPIGVKQIFFEKEKEQIADSFYSGYEDRDLFQHGHDYYNKMYERNGWQGILYLGEVDGVKIYYDSYHPDQTLTVELNKDKTEMVYIISSYDDITMFEGIKKNIIISEKPTNMIKPIPELQDPYSPTAKWITTQ
jgi:glycosylphosphatidylinositol transamidase (GPIT) subunit GPI8